MIVAGAGQRDREEPRRSTRGDRSAYGSPMNHEFWLQAWIEERTRFHQPDVHGDLIAADAPFLGGGPHRVLVPLCGRTLDLAWLAGHGHEVVGIELSPIAARLLFEDLGVEPEVSQLGPFEARRHGRLTLLLGDFFAATPERIGLFDRVWDRAALVAMDPERRGPYTATIASLLRPGGLLLQNTFSYDQARMEGPPFSIPPEELAGRYAGWEARQLSHELMTEGPFNDRLDEFAVTVTLLERPFGA